MKSWARLAVPALTVMLLIVPFGAAPASAATAAPPTPPTPAQVAFARTVAEFASTHSVPRVGPEPSIDAQQAVLAYWKALPIQALFGQYGCTVEGPEVRMQVGGDGVSRATASWASYCPPGINDSMIRFYVLPRADAHVAAASESTMAILNPNCAARPGVVVSSACDDSP
jgi:hypothetical protein